MTRRERLIKAIIHFQYKHQDRTVFHWAKKTIVMRRLRARIAERDQYN